MEARLWMRSLWQLGLKFTIFCLLLSKTDVCGWVRWCAVFHVVPINHNSNWNRISKRILVSSIWHKISSYLLKCLISFLRLHHRQTTSFIWRRLNIQRTRPNITLINNLRINITLLYHLWFVLIRFNFIIHIIDLFFLIILAYFFFFDFLFWSFWNFFVIIIFIFVFFIIVFIFFIYILFINLLFFLFLYVLLACNSSFFYFYLLLLCISLFLFIVSFINFLLFRMSFLNFLFFIFILIIFVIAFFLDINVRSCYWHVIIVDGHLLLSRFMFSNLSLCKSVSLNDFGFVCHLTLVGFISEGHDVLLGIIMFICENLTSTC